MSGNNIHIRPNNAEHQLRLLIFDKVKTNDDDTVNTLVSEIMQLFETNKTLYDVLIKHLNSQETYVSLEHLTKCVDNLKIIQAHLIMNKNKKKNKTIGTGLRELQNTIYDNNTIRRLMVKNNLKTQDNANKKSNNKPSKNKSQEGGKSKKIYTGQRGGKYYYKKVNNKMVKRYI